MIGSSLLLAAAARSSLLDGLVGYWPLDGNGNDALGVSNGVVEGSGSSWNTGKIGSAFYAGGSARVNVGGNAQIKPTSAITLGGWFWFNSASTGRFCSDWHQDGSKDRWIFPYAPSAALSSHFNSNVHIGTVNTVEIPLNTWAHLLVTALAGSTVATYRNAVAIATGTDGSLSRTGAGNVCIGKQEEVDAGIDGRIDEFSMWNRVLTGAEILEWYNAGAGKTHPF